MSFINYPAREICCKIVYYGPGLGGKTANVRPLGIEGSEGDLGFETASSASGLRLYCGQARRQCEVALRQRERQRM
jgi:hypothetical protein